MAYVGPMAGVYGCSVGQIVSNLLETNFVRLIMRKMSVALLALPILFLVACGGDEPDETADVFSTMFMVTNDELPVTRWDHRVEANQWTRATLTAIIEEHGRPLITLVPRDIQTWCPTYANNTEFERSAFWVGLLSAMAKHESTWNPEAVGGGGQWFGLVQISPATARGYGCGATSGEALKNGAANLSCAVRIMASTVPRDGVVAAGMRGVAADWGPFHSAAKRAEMAAWTSSQSYCN